MLTFLSLALLSAPCEPSLFFFASSEHKDKADCGESNQSIGEKANVPPPPTRRGQSWARGRALKKDNEKLETLIRSHLSKKASWEENYSVPPHSSSSDRL